MDVEFMMVCDYAATSPDGKLTMVGVFDKIFAAQLPAQIPHIGIAARCRDETPAVGTTRHSLEIRIKGPEGNVLQNMTGGMDTFNPGQGPLEPGGAVMPVAIGLVGLIFPKYGTYKVELWIDKRLADETPIFVQRPPGAPAPPVMPPTNVVQRPGAPIRIVIPPRPTGTP